MSDGLNDWGKRVSGGWRLTEQKLSLVERLKVRATPIDPATEWSGPPRTTAVEYQSHIRLVDFSADGQKRHFWALAELIPKGEPPGQTRPLALATAAFRLFWLSMLAQARAFRRR